MVPRFPACCAMLYCDVNVIMHVKDPQLSVMIEVHLGLKTNVFLTLYILFVVELLTQIKENHTWNIHVKGVTCVIVYNNASFSWSSERVGPCAKYYISLSLFTTVAKHSATVHHAYFNMNTYMSLFQLEPLVIWVVAFIGMVGSSEL